MKRGDARPLFALGRVVGTPRLLAEVGKEDILRALGRHVRGDWGEVGIEDNDENNLSVREGFRVLSAYRSSKGVRFWVITEADRSATTVLLPEEY